MFIWIKKIAKTISDKGGIFTFLRAQLSSQLASITDFLVTITLANVLTFVFHKPSFYVLATSVGQICGGITNCVVNYRWTFKSTDIKKLYIAIRYLPVWGMSLFLNTSGTYFLTELFKKIPFVMEFPDFFNKNIFIVSKLIVSLIVGFVWNYNMHKFFVYRNLNLKRFLRTKNSIKNSD